MASKPMRILVGCKRVIDYAVKVCITNSICYSVYANCLVQLLLQYSRPAI